MCTVTSTPRVTIANTVVWCCGFDVKIQLDTHHLLCSTLYRSRPSSTRVLFLCNNCNGVVVLTWTSLDTHRCLMIWWSPSLSFDCIPRHMPKQYLWISPRHLSTNIFSPNPVRLAIQWENTTIYFFSFLKRKPNPIRLKNFFSKFQKNLQGMDLI